MDGNSTGGPLDVVGVNETTGQSINLGHRGVELEILEIEFGRENFVVTSSNVFQGTRSRIHGHEVMRSTGEDAWGCRRRCWGLIETKGIGN